MVSRLQCASGRIGLFHIDTLIRNGLKCDSRSVTCCSIVLVVSLLVISIIVY